jgi:hypothetical protein
VQEIIGFETCEELKDLEPCKSEKNLKLAKRTLIITGIELKLQMQRKKNGNK